MAIRADKLSPPKSLDQMTGVFSLATTSQPKQRIRRKMTDAEKIEYRKRRIVKACDKCAQRKRKCHHNQPEMETVGASAGKHSQRAGKSTIRTSTKTSNSPNKSQHPSGKQSDRDLDELGSNDPFTTFSSHDFDDFTMLEDSFPEINIDDLLELNPFQSMDFTSDQSSSELFTPDVSPGQHFWPTVDYEHDFTLLGSLTPEYSELRIPGTTMDDEQCFDPRLSWPMHVFEPTSTDGLAAITKRSPEALVTKSRKGRPAHDDMLWEHLRTGQAEDRLEKPEATHRLHTHSDLKPSLESIPGYHDSHDSSAYAEDIRTNMNATLQQIHSRAPPRPCEKEYVSERFSDPREDRTIGVPDARQTESTSALESQKSVKPRFLARQERSTPAAGLECITQTPSIFAESVVEDINPATELFLLRRRIPKPLHSIVDRKRNAGDAESRMSSSQLLRPTFDSDVRTLYETELPGGGADERFSTMHSEHRGSPMGLGQTSRVYKIASCPSSEIAGDCTPLTGAAHSHKPVHTRLQSPGSSGFDSGTTPHRPGMIIEAKLACSSSIPPSDSTENLYTSRLSDHVRYRDHFGRFGPTGGFQGLFLFALSVLFMGLLVHFSGFVPPSTTVLLLAALIRPVDHQTKDTAKHAGLVNRAFRLVSQC